MNSPKKKYTADNHPKLASLRRHPNGDRIRAEIEAINKQPFNTIEDALMALATKYSISKRKIATWANVLARPSNPDLYGLYWNALKDTDVVHVGDELVASAELLE